MVRRERPRLDNHMRARYIAARMGKNDRRVHPPVCHHAVTRAAEGMIFREEFFTPQVSDQHANDNRTVCSPGGMLSHANGQAAGVVSFCPPPGTLTH
jgi:hypothetical protein